MLMAPTLTANLTRLGDALAAHAGCSLATLSKRLCRDSNFLTHIRGAPAGSFTARKHDDVLCCFAANWPAGLEWPADIPRPTPAEIAATIGVTNGGEA